MKRIVSVVLLFGCINAQAQVPNPGSGAQDSIDAIAKGLAQIAMETNPSGKVSDASVKAAEYSYKTQKTAWLDLFRFTVNLNEFTLQKTLGTNPENIPGRAFWPRYNLSMNLPFGTFTNLPKQTKVQYYQYQAQIENQNVTKQHVGLQTMTAYYDYVQTQRLYELQEEAVQDASFAFTKTEEKFSKGEVPLDVYTATSRRYNAERATKVTLEHNLLVNKAELENLIGMPLEAALRQVRTQRKATGSKR